MSEDQERETRDFVDYNPNPIMILSAEKYDLVRKHAIIISGLREKIMTVKEIHDLYMTDEEAQIYSVTQKTIYRYLDELETAGLIIVAGYRKTEGVKTSERLYGRTASIFFLQPSAEINNFEKIDDEEKIYISNTGKLLSYALGVDPNSLDEQKFLEFYQSYWKQKLKSLEPLLKQMEEENEDLFKIYREMSLDQVRFAIDQVQTFALLITNPEFTEKLRSLFDI